MFQKAKRPGKMHFVIDNSLVTHHIHVPNKVLGSVWTPLNAFEKLSIVNPSKVLFSLEKVY